MKKLVAVTVAVVFVLAFAAPVFASSMTHNAVYEMDGTIDLEKQVGHLCNTGAEMKQTIEGEGTMDKVMDATMVAGKITVEDWQDWVTAEDAVNNLTVTSVIELCAPAKHVYDADDAAFDGMKIPAWALYNDDLDFDGDFEDFLDSDNYSALSDQIWAVQVSADPGFSGEVMQDFEAAYGPYANADDFWYDSDEPANAWWAVDEDGEQIDSVDDLTEVDGIEVGADYVGNYFTIDQFARTSMGETKRYIDISSAWSGAYLYEDMSVVGAAEIDESFEMDDIAPGADTVPDWWDLF